MEQRQISKHVELTAGNVSTNMVCFNMKKITQEEEEPKYFRGIFWGGVCAEACWQPKGLRTLSYWPQFIGLSSTKATRNITDVVNSGLQRGPIFKHVLRGPIGNLPSAPVGLHVPGVGGRKSKERLYEHNQ